MNCDNVKELIPFIDDGVLSHEIVALTKEHLKRCSGCRKEYTDLRDTVYRVRKVLFQSAPEPVPGYLGLVRRRIEKKKRMHVLYYRLVSVAAVVVFTVSLALYGFMNRNTSIYKAENFLMGESSEDIDMFITSQNLTRYDIGELAAAVNIPEEPVILDALINYSYPNITLTDMINNMDEEELTFILAFGER